LQEHSRRHDRLLQGQAEFAMRLGRH
jgi:hypothetical protein